MNDRYFFRMLLDRMIEGERAAGHHSVGMWLTCTEVSMNVNDRTLSLLESTAPGLQPSRDCAIEPSAVTECRCEAAAAESESGGAFETATAGEGGGRTRGGAGFMTRVWRPAYCASELID